MYLKFTVVIDPEPRGKISKKKSAEKPKFELLKKRDFKKFPDF